MCLTIEEEKCKIRRNLDEKTLLDYNFCWVSLLHSVKSLQKNSYVSCSLSFFWGGKRGHTHKKRYHKFSYFLHNTTAAVAAVPRIYATKHARYSVLALNCGFNHGGRRRNKARQKLGGSQFFEDAHAT